MASSYWALWFFRTVFFSYDSIFLSNIIILIIFITLVTGVIVLLSIAVVTVVIILLLFFVRFSFIIAAIGSKQSPFIFAVQPGFQHHRIEGSWFGKLIHLMLRKYKQTNYLSDASTSAFCILSIASLKASQPSSPRQLPVQDMQTCEYFS